MWVPVRNRLPNFRAPPVVPAPVGGAGSVRGGSVSGSVSGGGSDTAISSSAASCFESVCIGGGVCEQLSVGTTSAQALTEQSRAAAESSANARRAALINNPLNIRDLSDASALPYVADAFFSILRHLLE